MLVGTHWLLIGLTLQTECFEIQRQKQQAFALKHFSLRLDK